MRLSASGFGVMAHLAGLSSIRAAAGCFDALPACPGNTKVGSLRPLDASMWHSQNIFDNSFRLLEKTCTSQGTTVLSVSPLRGQLGLLASCAVLCSLLVGHLSPNSVTRLKSSGLVRTRPDIAFGVEVEGSPSLDTSRLAGTAADFWPKLLRKPLLYPFELQGQPLSALQSIITVANSPFRPGRNARLLSLIRSPAQIRGVRKCANKLQDASLCGKARKYSMVRCAQGLRFSGPKVLRGSCGKLF